MYRVVLVTIHLAPGDEAVPLGSACVASALKADPSLSERLEVSLLEAFLGEDPARLASRVEALEPSAVGFSLYLWNRLPALETASLLRARRPGLTLFSGGPDAGARPEHLLGDSGGPFRFLIAGEGESASTAAFRALLEDDSAAGLNGIPGLHTLTPASVPARSPAETAETLPSPWLDGTLDSSERKHLLWELVRGCPYQCTYCYESRGEHRLRRLSPERIEAELVAFEKAGVEAVSVLDPTFNANPERTVVFLDRLLKLSIRPHWHFEVRAEHLNRAQAKRFAKLSCSLQIGLQSADPEVCAKVGRKLNRGLFTSKIDILNEEGVVFGLDLIYGLPGDRLSGFRLSLDYAIGLYPNNLDMFRLAILPGTVLEEEAAGFGMDWEREVPYLVKATPQFPAKDLLKAEALSQAADLFYNRGRAVAWFNQILFPLGDKPSLFLEGFVSFLTSKGVALPATFTEPDLLSESFPIEKLQLEYLEMRYSEAELDCLLPAVWDIVRFHGAWSRAIAEGISTEINFNYDPDEVTSEAAMDLEEFISLASMNPTRVLVKATDGEPLLSVL